jgi:hypothetical protein
MLGVYLDLYDIEDVWNQLVCNAANEDGCGMAALESMIVDIK